MKPDEPGVVFPMAPAPLPAAVAAPAPVPGWLALKWNYLGNLMRSLCQFGIGIVLARLLGPGPFGVVAIAWLLLGVGNLFADLGFGAALVQRAQLAPRDLRFIFTCQMTFGALLTGAGLWSADAIATYFHQPGAAPVIEAMALLFVFQALGQTAAAMLRRALDFKTLQQIGIASYLAGYVLIGVPAALLGGGVWSLVAAQLVQTLLNALLLLRVSRVPLAFCWTPGDPGLVRFGLKVTAANLSSWSISNLDAVVVGRVFDVVALGLYNRVLNLVTMPMSIITTGFQGVLFAACARSRHDAHALKAIYLETNAAVAMLCCPVFFTAALVPDTLVLALYGSQWVASAPLVTPLALAVLVNAMLAINGPILMASDRVGVELRNQLCTVLLFIPALTIAIDHTVVAVAWAVLATYVVRLVLLARDTLRLTGATVPAYLATLCTPALFGACIGAAAALADHALAFLAAPARLLAVATTAAAVWLALLRWFGGRFLAGSLGTLVNPARLPGPVRKLLMV